MTPEFLTALTPSAGKTSAAAPTGEPATEGSPEGGETFGSLLATLDLSEAATEMPEPDMDSDADTTADALVEVEDDIAGQPIPDWLRAALDAVENPTRSAPKIDTPDAVPAGKTADRAKGGPGVHFESAGRTATPAEPEAAPVELPPDPAAPAIVAVPAARATGLDRAQDVAAAQSVVAGLAGVSSSVPLRPSAGAASSVGLQRTSARADAAVSSFGLRQATARADVAPVSRAFVERGQGAPSAQADGIPGLESLPIPEETGSSPIPSKVEPQVSSAAAPAGSTVAATQAFVPDPASAGETAASVDAMPDLDAIGPGREDGRGELRAGAAEVRAFALPELKGGIVQRLQELVAKAEADGVTLRNGSGDLSTELELAPADLGKLKLTLATTERGLHLTVFVERPDSVEAVRRQLEGLHRALLSEGLALDGFDISGGQDRGEAGFAGARAFDGDPAETSDSRPADPEPSVLAPPAPRGRLDIRI